jgi:hypothetical protein
VGLWLFVCLTCSQPRGVVVVEEFAEVVVITNLWTIVLSFWCTCTVGEEGWGTLRDRS